MMKINTNMKNLLPQEIIENKILLIRGRKVILDKDLSVLYGVETRTLNQAVKRNMERFPSDFMFHLTKGEAQELLRSQIVILEKGKYSKYLPYAFTEQGVAMLSSVLNSKKAIQVNIQIIKTFVRLKEKSSSATKNCAKKSKNWKRKMKKDLKSFSM